MNITIWLAETDVTKVFLAGLIVGIFLGQFLILLLQALNDKFFRRKKHD